MTPRPRGVRPLAAALFVWASIGHGRTEPTLGHAPFAGWFEAVRLGEERPDVALAKIGPVATPRPAPSSSDPDRGSVGDEQAATTRARLLARGLVLASNGREREARQTADALRALDPQRHRSLGLAAAELVIARLYDNDGQSERSGSAALAALRHFDEACAVVACEPLPRWQAEMLVQRALGDDGRRALAEEHLARAGTLAAESQEAAAEVLTDLAAAWVMARAGEVVAAGARVRAAQQRAAGMPGEPSLQAQLLNLEGLVAVARGDLPAARVALRAGLAVAEAAGLARQGAVLTINLADVDLKERHPADAHVGLTQALTAIRAHGDRRRERTLLHNRGLARIALGDLAGGRRDIDDAQALWLRAGARGEAAAALREAGEAVAAAGDHAGALTLVHRERELVDQAARANRDAALAGLQAKFQRTAQEREIELKGRAQALREALIDNQRTQQRLWALIVAVALLAALAASLMLRRLHRTQQALAERRRLWQARSERDPLTGLSNRRHLAAQVRAWQTPGDDAGLRGGLLVIDVDRFKQINDRFGHGGGDLVLREVGARLSRVARPDDLLARWGGEEFVLVRRSADADEVEVLAQRLLEVVGSEPVALDGGRRCPITLSIGWAAFPLAPSGIAPPWESSLSLVDRLLYLAKAAGRNRAVGLAAAPGAADAPALRRLADDWVAAEHAGHVGLRRTEGPASAEVDAVGSTSPAETNADAQTLRTRTV